MNPKYDIYEQIDLYLNKQLTGEELALFNEKLAHDIDLQEMLEAQKIANELIVDNELLMLKARMQKDLNTPPPSGKMPYTLLGIVSVSAIVLTGAYFTYTTDAPITQKTEIQKTETKEFIVNTNPEIAEVKAATPKTITVSKPNIQPTITENYKNSQLTDALPQIAVVEKVSVATPVVAPLITTTEESNTKGAPISPIVDCKKVKLETSARVEYVNEEANIVINKKVIGGTQPYAFSIDGHEFVSENRFEDIKEGTYHISVQDANHCVTVLSKPLLVKYPVKEIDEVFNPSHGNRWNFPGIANNTEEATVTIVSKSGLTVFTSKIMNGYPADWDGRDNHGNELDAGNYFFIISFTNNKMIKGHISIVK